MIDCLGSPRSLHRGESASRWAPVAGGLEPPVAHSGSSHSATPARGWHPTRPGMGGGRGGEGARRGGAMQSCPEGAVSPVGGQRSGQYCVLGTEEGLTPRAAPPQAKGAGQ